MSGRAARSAATRTARRRAARPDPARPTGYASSRARGACACHSTRAQHPLSARASIISLHARRAPFLRSRSSRADARSPSLRACCAVSGLGPGPMTTVECFWALPACENFARALPSSEHPRAHNRARRVGWESPDSERQVPPTPALTGRISTRGHAQRLTSQKWSTFVDVEPDAKIRGTKPRARHFFPPRAPPRPKTVPFLHFLRPGVASADPVGRPAKLRRWHATWSSPDTAHCQRRLARV